MNPDDILLWPDGFWCFRMDLREEFLRDDKYRVIVQQSDEWLATQETPPFGTH